MLTLLCPYRWMENIINMNGTDVVINEDGGTNNFRVETDGDSNCFVVDSASDDVGIGTATPNGHNSPNGAKFVLHTSGQTLMQLNSSWDCFCRFRIY